MKNIQPMTMPVKLIKDGIEPAIRDAESPLSRGYHEQA